MRWRPPSGAAHKSRLAPVAAAAATTAVIPAGAGVVHAEVGAAHVAVTRARLTRLSRGDNPAATTAIQEVMGHLFAGNHAGAHRQPGGESARDAGADPAAAHRLGAVAAGSVGSTRAAHAGPRRGILDVGVSPAEHHQ